MSSGRHSESNEFTDAVLIVEEKRLHVLKAVSKGYHYYVHVILISNTALEKIECVRKSRVI